MNPVLTQVLSAAKKKMETSVSGGPKNKKFKVTYQYTDKDGKSIASGSITIDAVRDADHARHVFMLRNSSNKPNVKITRVQEVK